MIKTSHPINSDIILKTVTATSSSQINELATVYDNYNANVLPELLKKLSTNIKQCFFENNEQISAMDTVIESYEKADDYIEFKITSIQYQKEQKCKGSLLFRGVSDMVAEFDGSPVTDDYLQELLTDRMVYDVFFDVNNDGVYVVDIYSLNEEEFEDGKDLDDVELLHMQFKFTSFSFDLEGTQMLEEENE